MKRLSLLFLLLFPTVVLAQGKVSNSIDTKVSILKWTGHAEVGSYAPTGTLNISAGQVSFENGQFVGAVLTVDMSSMKQDNNDLVHHLKSSDFFDVEHFPSALVKIDRVEGGTAFGSLTVKGKPAPFQCPIKVTTNGNQFLITGTARLDRTKYGITYNSTSFFSGLGNKAIRNEFEVEFSFAGVGVIPAKYR